MARELPRIPHPVISTNGEPTHVIMPIDQYLNLFGEGEPAVGWTVIPSEVGDMALDGASPLKAWRKHLGLTQEEVATRMGITRPAYTQMEKSDKPRRDTLEKAAQAFGIEFAQLIELYDDEPVTTPDGPKMI